MGFPIPENEAERIAELHALELLESGDSAVLKGICALACEVLRLPSVAVALIDRGHQIFKAQSGCGMDGTSREHSFSTWTIMSSQVLIIPDASKDPRFANNIYVQGAPYIRFYAGVPLALRSGLNIGTLCLWGPEPRELSATEIEFISHLASIVIDQFRLHEATRRARRELESRRISQKLLEMQSRELSRRQSLLSQTERLARIGGWEFDVANGQLSWSDGIYRIYGLEVGAELDFNAAIRHFPREARQQFLSLFATALHDGVPFEIELPFVDAKGNHRLVRQTCELEKDAGEVVRAFGILQDVTERKEAEQRMWHMANHDALTGLPNRGLMREQLEAALRGFRRSRKVVAVLLLDVDQFKDVNDTLGHDAGDALLVEAANRLTSHMSDVDMVARLGGDEFIVVLSQLDSPGDAMDRARKLIDILGMPFSYKRSSLSCRCSIGIAVAPEHGNDSSTLLKNADIALYRAKAGGRGIAVEYNPRMHQAMERRLQLFTRVRAALSNKEFLPYYQPKISLRTGLIVGFEALMRWRHPRRGILGPSEFGQVFEDADLAVTIGEQLLHATTRDMAAWTDQGCDFGHIAINVSSPEFAREGLSERVLTALDHAHIAPERLTVEVTETVFLGRGSETVRQSLQALNKAGVRIALDDFGTGYASLSHLRQFPVDRIKIDRSFVNDIEHDIDDAAIVRAVINLGRSLGIEIVAEGVETTQQADYLRSNGCDFAQGFLFSKALPAARVPGFLCNWKPLTAGQPDAGWMADASGLI